MEDNDLMQCIDDADTARSDLIGAIEKYENRPRQRKNDIDKYNVVEISLRTAKTIRAALTQPKAGDASKLWYAYELLKPPLSNREYFADSDNGLMACVNVQNAFNQVEQYLRHNETPKADVEGLKQMAYEKAKWIPEDDFHRMESGQWIEWTIDHLAAQGYIGVPEGYALVPIEPTREMILSGSNYYQKHGALSPCIPAGIYKAMLKAAPNKEGE